MNWKKNRNHHLKGMTLVGWFISSSYLQLFCFVYNLSHSLNFTKVLDIFTHFIIFRPRITDKNYNFYLIL